MSLAWRMARIEFKPLAPVGRRLDQRYPLREATPRRGPVGAGVGPVYFAQLAYLSLAQGAGWSGPAWGENPGPSPIDGILDV